MAKFTQRVFDPTMNPAVAEFETLDQLLTAPCVARFARLFEFHQFSVANGGAQWALLAEYRDGQSSVVVGFLDEAVPQLPRWKGGSVG